MQYAKYKLEFMIFGLSKEKHMHLNLQRSLITLAIHAIKASFQVPGKN